MLRCFISYSHKDTAFVDMVARLLAYVPGTMRAFVDRTDHDLGTPLPAGLRAALDEADVLLPCVSEDYVVSEWCARERHWYLESGGTVTRLVVPLRIVPYDATRSCDGWFHQHPGVDFSDWVRRGDQILFDQLLPKLVKGPLAAPVPRMVFDGTRASAMAADLIEVLSVASRFELPAEADRALVQLAVAIAQSEGLGAAPRNALALALAGSFVQRGDWASLKSWALEPEAEGSADGDVQCQFYQFLGLAERRLGHLDAASAYLDRALDRTREISDLSRRRRAEGQIRREQGTLALGGGDLFAARARYRESREALRDFNSERAHVAQTWVKTAQIDLMAGDVDGAHRCLARAGRLLNLNPSGGHDSGDVEADGESLLVNRVAAHHAKTLALTCYVSGDLTGTRRAAAEHHRIIAPYDWANERRQARVLAWLLATAKSHPAVLRRFVARLGIGRESAGRLGAALMLALRAPSGK